MQTAVPGKPRLRRPPRKYFIMTVVTIVTIMTIIVIHWYVPSADFVNILLAVIAILVNLGQWFLPAQNTIPEGPHKSLDVDMFLGNPGSARNGPGLINPQPPTSAFFYNVPLPDIQEFYARDSERDMLIRRIQNKASTSIIGPRRIGKTWLLQYIDLLNRTDNTQHVGYLDVSLPGCKNAKKFTSLALEALGAQDTRANGLESLENFVRARSRQNQIPVLLIDEFEGFAATSRQFDLEFFNGLRSIAGIGLVLITVSRRSLLSIVADIVDTEEARTSPFFNIFLQITLKPFTRNDAEIFVTIKGQQIGLTVQEQACILQCGQSDDGQWQPLRLQLAGSLLLEDKMAAQQGHMGDSFDDPDYCENLRTRLDDHLPRTN